MDLNARCYRLGLAKRVVVGSPECGSAVQALAGLASATDADCDMERLVAYLSTVIGLQWPGLLRPRWNSTSAKRRGAETTTETRSIARSITHVCFMTGLCWLPAV